MSLTCPPESDLLQFVMRGAAASDGDVERHLRSCAICAALVQHLRTVDRSAQATPDLDVQTADCLDEVALADALKGERY